ncbi:hypothetical protein GCM10023346_30890 [Arthrobacter gyeryongensis]|uniref:Uncharacterized protein n=1 Tax=Arthrobacter gyeryongensis TaxID=1650592 RepID=A0ABP9SIM6_9MICC
MVKTEEKLFAVRGRFEQFMAVQKRCARSETALRAGDLQHVAGENILELTCQAMDGMPFRHYATISPVFS